MKMEPDSCPHTSTAAPLEDCRSLINTLLVASLLSSTDFTSASPTDQIRRSDRIRLAASEVSGRATTCSQLWQLPASRRTNSARRKCRHRLYINGACAPAIAAYIISNHSSCQSRPFYTEQLTFLHILTQPSTMKSSTTLLFLLTALTTDSPLTPVKTKAAMFP